MQDDERLRPLGSPRVLIERLPWQTTVRLDRAVWGMGTAELVFMGAGCRSAERYAQNLFDTLAEQADARVRYRLGRKARNAAGREVSRMLGRWGVER